ncbi:TIR domain-containing protein [Rhizobium leguminosarum bv. viciae]|uniref:toll/interleukin-1 receptor domain-containing protein n=1 Tax=Rhizobium leguminosarum TaxID=384 RepID=UPI001442964C|nr:toll/interleukin-1 receptor domain-containing protein [Rhizobium leguminosarum]NKJ94661.1 TIR domain-containing protein [Rhizobium leguminosarum bv. viciae]
MSLQTIFISHAKPEDNDFVRWLSARLTGAGYKVWAELIDSTGGSPFWSDIEVAIREHSVKFISVVSKASVASDRRGFRNELSIADSRGRTLKDNRFIVPIRLDDVTLDEFPAQLHQLHHIDFSSNWGEGYLDLIRSIEKMGVAKDASADNTLFRDWRRISESASSIVEVASERALTNLVQIVKLPRTVNVFSFQGDQDKFSAALKKTEVPCAHFYRLVVTFSDIVSLQERLPEHFRLGEHSTYAFEEFIDGTDKGATRPKKTDAKNMATAMLRANIERHLCSCGLREFPGRQAAFFFPKDLLPNNKVFYQLAQGKRTWKAVVGRSEKMGVFWHLAMKVNVMIGEDPLVRFKPYICWSENGVTPITDPKRTSAMRKRFCKNWWNPQWRGLQEAFIAFLADDKPTIEIELGAGEAFSLDRDLISIDLARRMPTDLVLYDEPDPPQEEPDDDVEDLDGDSLNGEGDEE